VTANAPTANAKIRSCEESKKDAWFGVIGIGNWIDRLRLSLDHEADEDRRSGEHHRSSRGGWPTALARLSEATILSLRFFEPSILRRTPSARAA
jgi:hypothetical protein